MVGLNPIETTLTLTLTSVKAISEIILAVFDLVKIHIFAKGSRYATLS